MTTSDNTFNGNFIKPTQGKGTTNFKLPPDKWREMKAEPVKAEPVKVEPVKVEPVKVEPVKVEPKKVEPKKAEPKKAEPVRVEPKQVSEKDEMARLIEKEVKLADKGKQNKHNKK